LIMPCEIEASGAAVHGLKSGQGIKNRAQGAMLSRPASTADISGQCGPRKHAAVSERWQGYENLMLSRPILSWNDGKIMEGRESMAPSGYGPAPALWTGITNRAPAG
jgi:hypothetical protein